MAFGSLSQKSRMLGFALIIVSRAALICFCEIAFGSLTPFSSPPILMTATPSL